MPYYWQVPDREITKNDPDLLSDQTNVSKMLFGEQQEYKYDPITGGTIPYKRQPTRPSDPYAEKYGSLGAMQREATEYWNRANLGDTAAQRQLLQGVQQGRENLLQQAEGLGANPMAERAAVYGGGRMQEDWVGESAALRAQELQAAWEQQIVAQRQQADFLKSVTDEQSRRWMARVGAAAGLGSQAMGLKTQQEAAQERLYWDIASGVVSGAQSGAQLALGMYGGGTKKDKDGE